MKRFTVLTTALLIASALWLSACAVRIYPAPRQHTVVERVIVGPHGTYRIREYQRGYRRGP